MDINSPPEGFNVKVAGDGYLEIKYRRTGMLGMNVFLSLWLLVWTFVCMNLLRGYLSGGSLEGSEPEPFGLVALFWCAELFVACSLIYCLFCRKIFKVDYESLSVDVTVLWLHWQKKIRLDEIIKFQQVKDGGDGEDSFPSWGLNVNGDVDDSTKTLKLISRQPYSRSAWLGNVLATQIKVPFDEKGPS